MQKLPYWLGIIAYGNIVIGLSVFWCFLERVINSFVSGWRDSTPIGMVFFICTMFITLLIGVGYITLGFNTIQNKRNLKKYNLIAAIIGFLIVSVSLDAQVNLVKSQRIEYNPIINTIYEFYLVFFVYVCIALFIASIRKRY